MAISKETRVRVEDFWKIMARFWPARRWWVLPALSSALSLIAKSNQASSSALVTSLRVLVMCLLLVMVVLLVSVLLIMSDVRPGLALQGLGQAFDVRDDD